MNLDILAFGAHPDDVEISMGGTILHYVEEGKQVGIIDITEGELGTRGSVETRYTESEESSALLGIHMRHNLQLKDGFFQHDEENLKKIIEQIRRFKPQIVFANSIIDRHPDHARAAKLVAEAAFLAGLTKIKTEWEGEAQTAHRPRLLLHYIQDYLKGNLFVNSILKNFFRIVVLICRHLMGKRPKYGIDAFQALPNNLK
jgi:bacillithiol biosynthesis deacetylase BshB1